MQKTPISPETRLLIAAQLLAGMQAPGYTYHDMESAERLRECALSQTDLLIAACDCYVILPERRAEQNLMMQERVREMWAKLVPSEVAELVNDENGH